MYYYILPQIGTGTEQYPFRPDIPVSVSWVGNDNGIDFLIATPNYLPDKIEILPQELENICNARGINFNDVMQWYAT